jgi:hypothetical protein
MRLGVNVCLKIRCKISLLYDKENFRTAFDEPELVKSLQEVADSRTGGTDHFSELLVGDPVFVFDVQAAGVLFAELSGQLQQDSGKAVLAIGRDQVADDLLLLGDAENNVLDKGFVQSFLRQLGQEIVRPDLFEHAVPHGRGSFDTPSLSQTQFSKKIAGGVDRQQTLFGVRRQGHCFNLATFNEVDVVIVITRTVNVIVFLDFSGGGLERLQSDGSA